jgi:hypothetical protein
MQTPDIRTASVASRKGEKRAVAVTMRWTTEELSACSSSPRGVRRGEKVPATVGTVGDAFGLLDLGPLGGKRATVRLGGTGFAASGTGLLVGKFVGLLLQEQLQGSLGKSLGGNGGDLLEGAEVHVESRSVVAEGPSGDDFAPLGGEAAKLVEFFGGESGVAHGSSCSEVTSRAAELFLSRGLSPGCARANRDVTSRSKTIHFFLDKCS